MANTQQYKLLHQHTLYFLVRSKLFIVFNLGSS